MSLYNHEKALATALRKIERSDRIDQDTKARIKGFLNQVRASGASIGIQCKYANQLWVICTTLNKPAKECTRKDIENLMTSLMEGYRRHGDTRRYSPFTLMDYTLVIKRFWKFVRYGNIDRETPYPDEVRWLRKTLKPYESKTAEFFTPDEVERMIQAAWSLRDKAMIAISFEAGVRTGELLLMNIGDIYFDEYGARIKVRGKTGERIVRIISSVPHLTRYLEVHRHRNDPSSPLWLSESLNNLNGRLSYICWYTRLKEIAKKAGITKRVHPYMLRHGSATNAAKYLTDSEMKVRYGWTMSSRMPAVYVHLSGQDIDQKLIQLNEGKAFEPPKPEFVLQTCARCGEKNSPGTRFCGRCGMPLDFREIAKSSIEIESLKRDIDEVKEMIKSLLKGVLSQPSRELEGS